MCAMYENLSFKIINGIVTLNELYKNKVDP
jgi:hypothetical protein